MKNHLFLLVFGLCGLCPAQPLLISAGCVSPCNPDLGYLSDRAFTGGSVWNDPSEGTGIYATLRYGPSFAYDFNLPNGLYQITFGLLEPNVTTANKRRFSITAGTTSTGPLDLFTLAGLHVPYRPKLLVLVGNGTLHIQFTASIGNAVVSSIEITQPPILDVLPTDSVSCVLARLIDGTLRCLPLGTQLSVANGKLVISGPVIADFEKCSGVLGASDCTGLSYVALSDGTKIIGTAPPPGFELDARWAKQ